MTQTQTYVVTALFPDRAAVEGAYQSAVDRGYDVNDVNLVMTDDTRKRHFAGDKIQTELGNKAAKGAGVGGAVGGTVGAVAAAIAAIGTVVVLPGAGLVVAGPLAAGIAGASAGALGGGLIGGLIGWGISEERVKHYDEGIKKGGILMGLRAKNEADAAHFEQSWKAGRAEHVYR